MDKEKLLKLYEENGITVETIEGRRYYLINKGKKIVLTSEIGFMELDDYNNDLTCKGHKDFDIVKVYIPEGSDFSNFFMRKYLKLIWSKDGTDIVKNLSKTLYGDEDEEEEYCSVEDYTNKKHTNLLSEDKEKILTYVKNKYKLTDQQIKRLNEKLHDLEYNNEDYLKTLEISEVEKLASGKILLDVFIENKHICYL